jgi:hypothetical protein
MRPLHARAILGFIATVGAIAIAFAADSDPVVGTWHLNVSKSTFTAGAAPKSQTRTYTQSGSSITLVMKTVGADGKESTLKTTYQLNGKDYPVTGAPDYDSLSAKQLNPYTATFTLKRAGKAVGRTMRTVSHDGKQMTSKSSATSAKGEQTESVMVFDRQ